MVKNLLCTELSLAPSQISEPLLHYPFNHLLYLSIIKREPTALRETYCSLATHVSSHFCPNGGLPHGQDAKGHQ